jgi:hypothetical protein
LDPRPKRKHQYDEQPKHQGGEGDREDTETHRIHHETVHQAHTDHGREGYKERQQQEKDETDHRLAHPARGVQGAFVGWVKGGYDVAGASRCGCHGTRSRSCVPVPPSRH